MQKELIQSLCQPGVLDPEGRVSVIETHISWVLLTDELAYKIKKAVNLGFLDFSHLSDRKRYCHEELRLNLRLAPSLYLDVVEITGEATRPRLDGPGPCIEYAVKMKRFPRGMELSEVTRRGDASLGSFEQFALELARFHASVPAAPPDSAFAELEALGKRTGDNFVALEDALHDPAMRRRVAVLKRWTERSLQRHADLFSARKQDGRIRECHGDLHLGNLVMLDGRIVAFDCLEFSETLRWIDVASELAFLLMDLYHRCSGEFARQTLNRYLEESGDYELVVLLRHYLVYRAMVRAKVTSLRDRQLGHSADSDQENIAYLDLAERFARHRQPRRLIITHGLSGSGKTWISRQLCRFADLVHLRSDVLRKHLHGLDQDQPSNSRSGEGIYSQRGRNAVYSRLLDVSERMLCAGYPVLADATFLDHRFRDQFRKLAESRGIPFQILHLEAPAPVLRERIRKRNLSGNDASEADLYVLKNQIRQARPLRESERGSVVSIDVGRDLQEADLQKLAVSLGLEQPAGFAPTVHS